MIAARALIMDDNRDFRTALKASLERRGFNARIATTAKRAIRLMSEQRFDVAFLDINMGDQTSGLDVLKRLRTTQPEVITVVITGLFEVGAVFERVVDRFVQKRANLDFDELAMDVRRRILRRDLVRAMRENPLTERALEPRNHAVLADELSATLEGLWAS